MPPEGTIVPGELNSDLELYNITYIIDIVRRMIFHWVPRILQLCVDWSQFYVDSDMS